MSSAVIETISGLVTAVFWGGGDWLTPRSKQKLGALQINFVINFVGTVIFAVMIAVTTPKLPAFKYVWEAAILSIVIGLGYLVFVKALTIGSVGVVVPLSSVFPLLTLILSVIFRGDSYSARQIFAVVIIISGAVLLAYEKNHQKQPLKQVYAAVIFTLIAVLLWGWGFFFLNPIIPHINWEILLFTLEFVSAVFATLLLVIRYGRRFVKSIAEAVTNKTVMQAGSLLGIGSITLYAGAGKVGNIIIPATISSMSPLLTSFLGAIVDKEKLGLVKRAGAVLAIGGIVILNV